MPQPLVLAIEPDLRQAAIVKRIVREKVLADVMVVDSRDAALEAMRTAIPDVLLLSALMSPREEDELVAHLRTLEHADHLQTHTIPLLASVLGPAEARGPRGLLSAFRRKKEPAAPPAGCDPDLFAEEIRVFLQRAEEMKRERANAQPGAAPANTAWRAAAAQPASPAAAEPGEAADPSSASSSWSSPFEWKPSSGAWSPVAEDGSSMASAEAMAPPPEPFSAAPAPMAAEPAFVPAPQPGASSSDGAAASAASLMAHLRPPAGIPTVSTLAAQEQEPPADAYAYAAAPVPAAEPVAVPPQYVEMAAPAPAFEPVELADTRVYDSPAAEAAVYSAPIDDAQAYRAPVYDEPVHDPPAFVDAPVHAAPVDEAPIYATAIVPAPAAGTRSPVTRSRHDEPGLGIREQRTAMRDLRLGALAGWARAEARKRDAVQEADDLRALLTSLAVPSGVVAVAYARGCRIRRVRVPTAREPHETEAVGAVILSRRALAEQREQPPA